MFLEKKDLSILFRVFVSLFRSLSLSFCLSHFVLFIHWPITLIMCYSALFDRLLRSVHNKCVCRDIGAHTHRHASMRAHTRQRKTSERVNEGRCGEIGDSCWQISQEICQIQDLFFNTEITQFLMRRGCEDRGKEYLFWTLQGTGVKFIVSD